MSLFQVKLNNGTQGMLDNDPYGDSIQRSIYVAGPDRISVQLKDGQTFKGPNYWKRFAYPQTSKDQAFLIVLEDDGSVWSDYSDSNNVPKVYKLIVNTESNFEDNSIDIESYSGKFAEFVQITNQSNEYVKIKLNGLSDAIFELGPKETQVFNYGEINIKKIEAAPIESSEESVALQIILAIPTK